MSRKTAIDTISVLYPADAKIKEVAEVGKELLIQALCLHWRDLPDPILYTLARLNEVEERIKGKRMF